MASPRFLYFDLGSTLIDELPSMNVRAQLTCERLATIGLSLRSEDLLNRCFSHGRIDANSPYHAALRELLASHHPSVRTAITVPYDHSPECLFPGVPELLRELTSVHRLGVIANQSAGTDERLRAFGIRDFFEVVLSSAEFGRAKPDPEIFAEAERRAGFSGENLVMIGDRLDNDIRPARARGWRTIRVLQGFSREQRPAGPLDQASAEIDHIADVPAALAAFQNHGNLTPCLSPIPVN